MTPKRIKALEWIFDTHHLGLPAEWADGEPPSDKMGHFLVRDGLLHSDGRLTEKGLQVFHEEKGA